MGALENRRFRGPVALVVRLVVQLWRDSGRDMVREGFRFAQPRRGWRVMGWRGRAQRPWCRSPCVLRAVFFVLVRNNPSLRIASASQRIPVGPARRSPRTPSDKRHTNAYGCHESPFEPSIDSLIHRQEAKERPSVGWVRGDNGKPRRHPSPGYSPANGTGTAMTAKEKT